MNETWGVSSLASPPYSLSLFLSVCQSPSLSLSVSPSRSPCLSSPSVSPLSLWIPFADGYTVFLRHKSLSHRVYRRHPTAAAATSAVAAAAGTSAVAVAAAAECCCLRCSKRLREVIFTWQIQRKSATKYIYTSGVYIHLTVSYH